MPDSNELLKKLQAAKEEQELQGTDAGKLLDEAIVDAEKREQLLTQMLASMSGGGVMASLIAAMKNPWYANFQPPSDNSLLVPVQPWQRPGLPQGASKPTSDNVTPKEGYGGAGGGGSGGFRGGSGGGDDNDRSGVPGVPGSVGSTPGIQGPYGGPSSQPEQLVNRARTPFHDTHPGIPGFTSGDRAKTPFHSTHPGFDPGQYKVGGGGGTTQEQIINRARTPFHDAQSYFSSAGRGKTPWHSTHPGFDPGQYRVSSSTSYGAPPSQTSGEPITKFGVGVGGYSQEQIRHRPIEEQHTIHFEGFKDIDTKQQFDYGTGHRITGKWGAPYGTYSLTPQPLSSATTIHGYYQRTGIPTTGSYNTVYNVGRGKGDPTHTGFDPAAGRGRGSIQIHATPEKLGDLHSAGCLAIQAKEFPAFRQAFDQAWKQSNGQIAIEVGPHGATIRPIQGFTGQKVSADQAIQNQKSTGSVTGTITTDPQKIDPQSATIRTKLTAQEGVMMGSGFHVGGGYFITDSHNIKTDTKSLEVEYGGRTVKADVLHNSPNTDYAVLKVSPNDAFTLQKNGMQSLPYSKLDPDKQDSLKVSGYPGNTGKYTSFEGKYGGIGEPVTLTHGGTITTPREIGREYRVFPNDRSRLVGGEGMSGGPVTNQKGEVIGALTGIGGPPGGQPQELSSMPVRRMFEDMPEDVKRQVESGSLQGDQERQSRQFREGLDTRIQQQRESEYGISGGRGGGIGGRRREPSSRGSGGVGGEYYGSLKEQRERFRKELDANPELRRKVVAIAANENNDPRAQQGVIETMMNRAAMRGHSLASEAKWVTEHGYYDDRHGGHGRGDRAAANPRTRTGLDSRLEAALGGSNVSKWGTGNASGEFVEGRIRRGMYSRTAKYGGESFVTEGGALYKKWRQSVGQDRPIAGDGETRHYGGSGESESAGGIGGGIGRRGAQPKEGDAPQLPSHPERYNQESLAAKIQSMNGHLSSPQCVELARAMVHSHETVRSWRRGENVMGGNMPLGTPMATFMDRKGHPSMRYDAGGIGAPGNNTTHALIFAGYNRDKDGKITGFRAYEQYKGSGGIHLRNYEVGNRRGGEKDAKNYYAINDPHGQPLGGEHNPLYSRSTKEDTPKASEEKLGGKEQVAPTASVHPFSDYRAKNKQIQESAAKHNALAPPQQHAAPPSQDTGNKNPTNRAHQQPIHYQQEHRNTNRGTNWIGSHTSPSAAATSRVEHGYKKADTGRHDSFATAGHSNS